MIAVVEISENVFQHQARRPGVKTLSKTSHSKASRARSRRIQNLLGTTISGTSEKGEIRLVLKPKGTFGGLEP